MKEKKWNFFSCGIDRYLLNTPEYQPSLLLAFKEAHVFKYADRSTLYFTCQVTLCVRYGGGCDQLTVSLGFQALRDSFHTLRDEGKRFIPYIEGWGKKALFPSLTAKMHSKFDCEVVNRTFKNCAFCEPYFKTVNIPYLRIGKKFGQKMCKKLQTKKKLGRKMQILS